MTEACDWGVFFADEVLNAPFLPPIFFVLLDLVVWIGGKK